jgi:hypothetical protein
MKPFWPNPVSGSDMSTAKDHADAIWLCAAASEAAKDGRFQDALRLAVRAAVELRKLATGVDRKAGE